MQGKSCFNFTKVDEPLISELARLTKASFEATGGDPRWGAVKRQRQHAKGRRSPVPATAGQPRPGAG